MLYLTDGQRCYAENMPKDALTSVRVNTLWYYSGNKEIGDDSANAIITMLDY